MPHICTCASPPACSDPSPHTLLSYGSRSSCSPSSEVRTCCHECTHMPETAMEQKNPEHAGELDVAAADRPGTRFFSTEYSSAALLADPLSTKPQIADRPADLT